MTWNKEMPANPVVAVAGATGAVGQEFMNVLHDLDFPASEVRALASARSAGKKIEFGGCGQVPAGELTVQEMTPEAFEGVDIALFSAGASVSKQMREAVTAAGAVMIDNSSAFRIEDDVPLIVPEVNPDDASWHNGVIANPNCTTIIMALPLKALHDVSPIKRVVVSSYQAASGAGAPAMAELYDQTREFLERDARRELAARAELAAMTLAEPLRTHDFASVHSFGESCRAMGYYLCIASSAGGRLFANFQGVGPVKVSVRAIARSGDCSVMLFRPRAEVLAPFRRAYRLFLLAALAGAVGMFEIGRAHV